MMPELDSHYNVQIFTTNKDYKHNIQSNAYKKYLAQVL